MKNKTTMIYFQQQHVTCKEHKQLKEAAYKTKMSIALTNDDSLIMTELEEKSKKWENI